MPEGIKIHQGKHLILQLHVPCLELWSGLSQLGQLGPPSSAACNLQNLSLGLASPCACSFLLWTSHGSGVSIEPWASQNGYHYRPHIACSQWLSGNMAQDAMTSSVYLSCFQNQGHMDNANKFCCQLQTPLGTLGPRWKRPLCVNMAAFRQGTFQLRSLSGSRLSNAFSFLHVEGCDG